MIYFLYSPRGQGWFTAASTYSSDVSQAKAFDRESALEMVQRHRAQGAHNMLPIRQEDLQ